MDFFERLTILMKERGLSQAALEKEVGISNGSVSKWKKSIPKADTMNKLADYFGVSADYLLLGKEKGDDPEDKFSMIVNKLRLDPSMTDALDKYFNLSDEKKKHIIETINMLCEG